MSSQNGGHFVLVTICKTACHDRQPFSVQRGTSNTRLIHGPWRNLPAKLILGCETDYIDTDMTLVGFHYHVMAA